MLVFDASVVASWTFRDEVNEYGERVLRSLKEAGAVVPAVWPLEVANLLLTGERRQRLTQAESAEALELVRQLGIRVAHDSSVESMAMLLRLGREGRLTSYDASYLSLAGREGFPLATLDQHLRAAAHRMGVDVFE